MGKTGRGICIFNGDMSRGGGTERITQILANGLVNTEENCDTVWVLNLNNATGISYYPLNEKVRFYTLPGDGVLSKIREMIRFVRREKIRAIIDVDVWMGLYALGAKLFCPKLKVISWEMFNIRNDIGSKHTKLLRKLCLRFSSAYITQTKGDMKAFQEEMPVRCPICYIHNPVELDQSYEGYDQDSKVIMTAGHFFHTKGFDLAVEVARNVFNKHPDWQWRFYGDGIRMDETKALVERYGLQKNVIFCGRTNQLAEAYKEASMYVMTSRTEGFGLVLTEAKAANLPTLAFDVEFGPGEIIEDGVSGALVPAFDCELMSERICSLIENEELRLEYSRHAKDNLHKFSLEKFISRWREVLKAV